MAGGPGPERQKERSQLQTACANEIEGDMGKTLQVFRRGDKTGSTNVQENERRGKDGGLEREHHQAAITGRLEQKIQPKLFECRRPAL